MSSTAEGAANNPTAQPEFTLLDRLALQDAAGDIAFAVASGFKPREDDLAKFRTLHRKRSLFLHHEPMFTSAGEVTP